MGLTVCPTAVVAAPVELVWQNLVQWERYADWADVHAERIEPEGRATAGQTIEFSGRVIGLTLHFTFEVDQVDHDRHQLDLHAFFPLGLEEKPHVSCTPIDATSCRVAYG